MFVYFLIFQLIVTFISSSEKNGKEEENKKLEMVGPFEIVSEILNILLVFVVLLSFVICEMNNNFTSVKVYVLKHFKYIYFLNTSAIL